MSISVPSEVVLVPRALEWLLWPLSRFPNRCHRRCHLPHEVSLPETQLDDLNEHITEIFKYNYNFVIFNYNQQFL